MCMCILVYILCYPAAHDGTEWLKSRGRIVGLDKVGNEVEHSFVDPELYYKVKRAYSSGCREILESTTLPNRAIS
jgi:hypothetical protein